MLFFFLLAFCTTLSATTELLVVEKTITVHGKTASVYSINQRDGTPGLRIKNGIPFDVLLKNTLNVPTGIHWHGLVLPNNQDGVAFITQYPIYPGESYHYRFPLKQSGTFWMHSHYGLQEQRLLAAPLIIEGPDDAMLADQEAVLMLTDFSFTPPSEIYRSLLCRKMEKAPELLDVHYDAYLANNRTLQDPEVMQVIPGDKVRLRIINASSATNFFIDLGGLQGDLIAVDGNRIKTLNDNLFEIATAQRLDIVVKIPANGGAFPILALAEGTDKQTGAILATAKAKIPIVKETAMGKAGALGYTQEKKLMALTPLHNKKVDKQIAVELAGSMQPYVWTMNGQAWPESTPLVISKGERVEITFNNRSQMSHPMHLHGHVFQVTAIDGVPLNGAMRDTVLVLPHSTLAIQFDADNPGVWPFHCHILYHLEAGMFTVVRYNNFLQPL